MTLIPVLEDAGGHAPHGWRFDSKNWWLDENGLIMEPPDFPLPPGTYLVTGGREKASALTVHPKRCKRQTALGIVARRSDP